MPTETEITLGAFEEMLEPQVKEAVLQMHRKGYSVEASGFTPKYSDTQIISGIFTLDNETKTALVGHGLQINQFPYLIKHSVYTEMFFQPQEADLVKIKEKWDLIADLLPNRGKLVLPTSSDNAVRFRKTFAPHSPYLDEWQRRILDIPKGAVILSSFMSKLRKNSK